jgi:hypothetical protein
MDFIKQIVIQDVIGFFQSSFLSAMEGMSSAITISKEEQARINWGKPLRGDFSNQQMDEIIPITATKLSSSPA